mgnify:CR=1 FL=1
MLDAAEQFKEAMQARGLVPPVEIQADGEIHRCHAEGRGGENDGAYLLHLDGIPAGGFENWKDGAGWENWRADIGRTLTPEEEAAHRSHTEAMRKAREAEDKRRKAEARERAKRVWDSALPCTGHPYLTRKGIKAHGARIVSNGYREGYLVMPMRDAEGKLHSLQFIEQDGGKLFLPVCGWCPMIFRPGDTTMWTLCSIPARQFGSPIRAALAACSGNPRGRPTPCSAI